MDARNLRSVDEESEQVDVSVYAQKYGHGEQPLLRRGEVRSVVELLPQRHIIISTSVKVRLERYARRPMEHKIGDLSISMSQERQRGEVATTYAEVEQVGQGPAHFLSHSWYYVKHNLTSNDQEWMHNPCACDCMNGRFSALDRDRRENSYSAGEHLPLRLIHSVFMLS